ncbi:hypothetical protein HanRHA438_Chr05g0227951 [Helianthus annuus]|nr:hypothetical protein HanRHA438_Chr05g0227951 [Helianthus annuus]
MTFSIYDFQNIKHFKTICIQLIIRFGTKPVLNRNGGTKIPNNFRWLWFLVPSFLNFWLQFSTGLVALKECPLTMYRRTGQKCRL